MARADRQSQAEPEPERQARSDRCIGREAQAATATACEAPRQALELARSASARTCHVDQRAYHPLRTALIPELTLPTHRRQNTPRCQPHLLRHSAWARRRRRRRGASWAAGTPRRNGCATPLPRRASCRSLGNALQPWFFSSPRHRHRHHHHRLSL
eukprot:COSAG02_NODE_7001_length_3234_cov_1.376396_1_plen_156_part_00